MKYLVITNHSYMLWRFRKELVCELLKDGEVVISTPFAGHEADFEKIGCRCIDTKLDRRGINPVKDLNLFFRYLSLLKKEKPDCVITYSIKPNIYAGLACRLLKIPYFANIQGLGTAFEKRTVSSVVTVMYRLALKKARRAFFENGDDMGKFTKWKILPQERCTLLCGAGVNLGEYKAFDYPDESDGVHFLYLGRIMKEKGADELFFAQRKLKEKYGDKVKFDIVGFFEDEYKEEVEKLEKDGIVKYYGFQSDPVPFYRDAHCVVLPSYHEGMSNVLLEGAACGRALVASDIAGCREAVKDGTTGFLCRKADGDDLFCKLENFMSLSQSERATMGQNGRALIEEKFDRKDVVETVCRIISDGLKR